MATPFRTPPEPLPQTRVNAASQLADRLRAAIMDNSLPPDTRLSEVETAQQYGVSRQPVREAFIALAGQGLLDVRAQRGTFVTRISLAAVMDARFVREAIEADIVKLLAADPDPALIADLDAQLTRQMDLIGGSARDFMDADELFHRTLAEGAGLARAFGQPGDFLNEDRGRLLHPWPVPEGAFGDLLIREVVLAIEPIERLVAVLDDQVAACFAILLANLAMRAGESIKRECS